MNLAPHTATTFRNQLRPASILIEQVLQDCSDIPGAIVMITSAMGQRGYSELDHFAMELCLSEAMANAICHGNGNDPGKTVFVRCHVDREEVRVEVEDEGPGFNPKEVPDPRSPENLERAGGRGVFLMRTYMTSVEFNSRGNRVTLRRARTRAS